MSIWGAQPEENDDAADWLADLTDEPSIVAINEAFDEVLSLERDDYLEVTEGAAAVAAAHIVHQLFAPRPDFKALEVGTIAELRRQLDAMAKSAQRSLVQRAIRSLKAVTHAARSELHQLMHEDKKMGADWFKRIQALSLGLTQIAAGLK